LFYATELVFEAGKIAVQNAVDKAKEVAAKDADDTKKIGEFGNELIKDGFSIQTHCNAGWLAFVDYGTALSPIYFANKAGKKYLFMLMKPGREARVPGSQPGNFITKIFRM